VINPELIAEARKALGRQLAARREATGLTQEQLAPLVHYRRSTVANAETGHSTCSRTFWERCDEVLGANGALLRRYDDFKALRRRHHIEIAERLEADRGQSGQLAAPAADGREKIRVGGQFDPGRWT
jgi:DNA-binding XRE family transcriptional regulator